MAKITYPQWHAMKLLHDPEYRNNAPILQRLYGRNRTAAHVDIAVHYFGVQGSTIYALGKKGLIEITPSESQTPHRPMRSWLSSYSTAKEMRLTPLGLEVYGGGKDGPTKPKPKPVKLLAGTKMFFKKWERLKHEENTHTFAYDFRALIKSTHLAVLRQIHSLGCLEFNLDSDKLPPELWCELVGGDEEKLEL